MSETVTIHVAKTHLSELIARAEAGEEIIIARRDQPVVKLVVINKPKPKRVPGRLQGLVDVGPDIFDPLPEEELSLWNGEGGDGL